MNECDALSQHGIALAGFSNARDGFRFVRPRPRLAQILCTLSGWGWVLLEGEWRQMGPGHAYVTPLEELHAYYAPLEGDWNVCWVIYEEGAEEGIPSSIVRPTVLEVRPEPLAVAIEGLYRECMTDADHTAQHHWANLIHTYAQRMVMPAGSGGRLHALWEHVDQDLEHPWTVQEMADLVGVSGEHLRRICQTQLQRSPMRQVTHLRMRRAAGLLSSDSYTVEEVAEKVGYANSFAFSTAFKRAIGVSPTAYRQRSRTTDNA